jgi:hypothetical protein
MENKELEEIVSGDYSWIKIKKGPTDCEAANPMTEWKSEYFQLLKHHKQETNFLIAKCQELAKEALKDVHVTYDPLNEKVICVHNQENKDCALCEAIENDGRMDNTLHGYAYTLEEHKHKIQREDGFI